MYCWHQLFPFNNLGFVCRFSRSSKLGEPLDVTDFPFTGKYAKPFHRMHNSNETNGQILFQQRRIANDYEMEENVF